MASFLGGLVAGCVTTILGAIIGYSMGVSNAHSWMVVSKTLISSFASMFGNDNADEDDKINDFLETN